MTFEAKNDIFCLNMTREIVENDTSSQSVAETPIDTSPAYGGISDSQIYGNIVSQLRTYHSPGKIEGEEVKGQTAATVDKSRVEIDLESHISSARGNIVRLDRIRRKNYSLVPEEEKKAA